MFTHKLFKRKSSQQPNYIDDDNADHIIDSSPLELDNIPSLNNNSHKIQKYSNDQNDLAQNVAAFKLLKRKMIKRYGQHWEIHMNQILEKKISGSDISQLKSTFNSDKGTI